MSNKEFYREVRDLINRGDLIYACGKVPEMFVQSSLWGHVVAIRAEKAAFMAEIKNMINRGQIFNQRELEYALHKSASYIRMEVIRGTYALITAGKYKLYIIKDW